MIEILLILTFLCLLFGSYTDLKIKEVPDFISYSMIILGLGLRLVYSTMTLDWMFLIYGLVWFLIFFGLGCLMYYTAQWGGGDAKVLMGLGALLGFDFTPFSFLISFIINLFFVGSLYGLFWAIFLAFKNREKFLKEFKFQIHKSKKIHLFFAIFSLIFILSSFLVDKLFLKLIIFVFSSFFYLSYHLFIFVKSVENSCMYKIYPVSRLTEGDWIAKEIKHKGKYICGPKDLGISKKQIALLKKYHFKNVLVKEGIPFIPSFLISFIITYFFGNLMFRIFGY